MTEEKPSNASLVDSQDRFRWSRLVLASVIFLSGAVVGGVVARIVTREQVLAMLTNPDAVPDRVLPRLKVVLNLSDEQSHRVESIVRQRYAAMDAYRLESHTRMQVEFRAMQSEVSDVLTPDQQSRWKSLSDYISRKFLRASPAT